LRFLQLTCPQEFILFGVCSSLVGIEIRRAVFSSGADTDQTQRNNAAALAVISPMMMRLIPGR
jgi:hypothetical protein